jgi:hypothetical protein
MYTAPALEGKKTYHVGKALAYKMCCCQAQVLQVRGCCDLSKAAAAAAAAEVQYTCTCILYRLVSCFLREAVFTTKLLLCVYSFHQSPALLLSCCPNIAAPNVTLD